MADTTVKYMHSAMAGAPSLGATAGSLIALLDACLVNGFGSGNVDSIVISGGVATVTRAAGHPFEVDSVVLIAGATVSGGSINGEQKVTSVTTTTYTFACPGIANQTATGSITHKVAPLGWNKPFSGTNLAAYKPADPTASGSFLRVDDTGTTNARVLAYEDMTGISTGTGPFPTAAQMSGGGYWPKANNTSGTRSWVLVGDGRTFYLFPLWHSTTAYAAVLGFGDIVSYKSPDAYQAFIQVGISDLAVGTSPSDDLSYAGATNGKYIARGVSGLGGSTAFTSHAASIYPSPSRSGAGAMLFPNPSDNGLYVSQMVLLSNAAVRGIIPGIYHCNQGLSPSNFPVGSRITSVNGLSGRVLKALASDVAVTFVDVTGPWR